MIFKSRLPALPYIVWAAAFTLIPLFMVGYFAFTGSGGEFTLVNISDVAKFGPVFVRSVILGLIATAICLVLAYPFAFMMSRLGGGAQKIMMMLLMLPMWMNFILRTYALMTLLEKLQVINTGGAVVCGMVYNYLPFMILPIHSVIIKIDQSVIEAAQDLGASSSKVFLKVIFPLSLPGVISGVTMVFVPSISTFIISRLLGGSTTLLLGDLIEMQFLGAAYNPHLGAAVSLVMMIVVVLCMTIMNRFGEGEEQAVIM